MRAMAADSNWARTDEKVHLSRTIPSAVGEECYRACDCEGQMD